MTTATDERVDLDEVFAAIDKAWDTVSALCDGKIRWTMRVPAEPDRDPDLIISNALRLARQALETTR